MKRKILFIWMLLLTGAANSFAQSGTCGEGLTWTYSNGTLTISGTGAMTDYIAAPWLSYNSSITTVIIEDGVTSIGNWAFDGFQNLTSIIISNSVTSIGEGAFFDCAKLTSITLPKNLINIGAGAFSHCYALTSITIPASVTGIGDDAFKYCTNLTAIQVESGNTHYLSEDGVLFNKDKTELLCFPAAKTGDYVIPATITTIDYAFENSSLTSIAIPAGITSIGNDAFSSCSNLSAIRVEDGNTHYSSADGVLFNNDKTRLLCFPAAKTGDYTIPNTVTKIEDYAFQNNSLTSITIPENIADIKSWAILFSGCTGLISVKVAAGNPAYSSLDGVIYNKDQTTLLYYPPGKQNDLFTVPNTVKTIGKQALYRSINLSSVIIPEGVTHIENEAFARSKLKTVNIAQSVTLINHWAFYNCQDLTDVTVFWDTPSEVTLSPTYTNDIFEGVNKSAVFLHVPAGTEAAYQAINTWKDFYGIDWTLLSGLTANSGTLEPDFSSGVFSYSLLVPFDVENLVLAAIPFEGSNSTVSGDGAKALNTGKNTFEITITASYGRSQNYTVNVFRQPENYLLQWDSHADTYTRMELNFGTGKFITGVITGRNLYYNLQTGDFSGSLPLHFDLENGVSCDRPVAVQPHSLYKIRVYVSITPDNPITVITPIDAYGRPGTPYVDYTYHPWTITASDGNGVIQTDITVTGTVTTATVADITLEGSLTGIVPVEKASLRVYPNPVSESFRIEGITAPTQITVTDISGKTLLQQTVRGDESISVGYLPQGIYLIHVNGMTEKIIKN